MFVVAYFIVSYTCYLFTCFVFYKSFNQTRNYANFYFATGTAVILVAYTFGLCLGLIGPDKEKLAYNLLTLTNIFLNIGIFLITLALFYIRTRFFTPVAISSSFLIGIGITLIMNDSNVRVNYYPDVKFWLASYSASATVLASITFLFIALLLIFYFGLKFKYSIKRRKFNFTLVGLIIIFIWMATAIISPLYYLRIFLLPLGIGFIGLDNFLNPLSLFITKYPPEEVILFTSNNAPLLRYNYCSDKLIDDLTDPRLLRVSERLIVETCYKKKTSQFHLHRVAGGEIYTLFVNGFFVTIIGKQVGPSLKSAVYKTICEFSKEVNDTFSLTSGILKKEEEEQKFVAILKKNIDLIYA